MQLFDNPIKSTLLKKAEAIQQVSLESLLNDESREALFILNLNDLKIDCTRNHITEDIQSDLLDLAKSAKLPEKMQALSDGKKINTTENLAVEHMGQRDPIRFASEEWIRLESFVKDSREKNKFSSIINIGIGGSDLGPSAVAKIMKNYASGPDLYFVSHSDPIYLSDLLSICDPTSTLVVVSSKSFNTSEILENAKITRKWFVDQGVSYENAMIAVTAFPNKAISWGIMPDKIFDLPLTVGGRFSVWSAIGLPLMLGIGVQNFKEFLRGGSAMDKHFFSTPLEKNIPVLLGLLRVWNRNFLGYQTHAILTYEPRLRKFISWVQQLEMESNGKGVDLLGNILKLPAAPLIWGDTGTNWQHSVGQFLMQGIESNPVDILFARKLDVRNSAKIVKAHQRLLSNVLAQASALALGSIDNLNMHKNCEGNRPSNLISWETTSPYAIGRLFALYEYITIVCGFIWDINSFDQWGVENGKKRAKELLNLESFNF
jgi:glucose-6-phosphate isomerase